jgi:hypothetical protein
MHLGSQEHIEIMAMFEREFRGFRMDREDKKFWPIGRIYQAGDTNEIFLAYRKGYAFAKGLHQ